MYCCACLGFDYQQSNSFFHLEKKRKTLSLNSEIVMNTMRIWWCQEPAESTEQELRVSWGLLPLGSSPWGISQPLGLPENTQGLVLLLLEGGEVSILPFAQTQKSALVGLEHFWLQKGQNTARTCFLPIFSCPDPLCHSPLAQQQPAAGCLCSISPSGCFSFGGKFQEKTAWSDHFL